MKKLIIFILTIVAMVGCTKQNYVTQEDIIGIWDTDKGISVEVFSSKGTSIIVNVGEFTIDLTYALCISTSDDITYFYRTETVFYYMKFTHNSGWIEFRIQGDYFDNLQYIGGNITLTNKH